MATFADAIQALMDGREVYSDQLPGAEGLHMGRHPDSTLIWVHSGGPVARLDVGRAMAITWEIGEIFATLSFVKACQLSHDGGQTMLSCFGERYRWDHVANRLYSDRFQEAPSFEEIQGFWRLDP